jgi:hypothetical protein
MASLPPPGPTLSSAIDDPGDKSADADNRSNDEEDRVRHGALVFCADAAFT